MTVEIFHKNEIRNALEMIMLVARCIKDAREIPSGIIYASMINSINLDGYESIIRILVKCGLVSKNGNLLKWIGPDKEISLAGDFQGGKVNVTI